MPQPGEPVSPLSVAVELPESLLPPPPGLPVPESPVADSPEPLPVSPLPSPAPPAAAVGPHPSTSNAAGPSNPLGQRTRAHLTQGSVSRCIPRADRPSTVADERGTPPARGRPAGLVSARKTCFEYAGVSDGGQAFARQARRTGAGPLLALLLLLGCAGASQNRVFLQETPLASPFIRGTVRHAVTGDPIAGASILLEIGDTVEEATTDTRGHYEIGCPEEASSGIHVLVRHGSSSVTRGIEVLPGEGVELNFWLDPDRPCESVQFWKRASVPSTRPRNERVVGHVGACGDKE
jgi:hypothetical protein